MQNPNDRPTTYQKNIAKLPRALAPLLERPQWAVWRWTQQQNGRWQKPPFMARAPQRHASTSDPSTWSDYETTVATVQAGDADGITYMLTEDDPFAAIDLDHCRDPYLCSIDVWAQNFLDVGRHSYSEITPSGNGCRIWGLAAGDPLHKKFTLVIDDKEIAVELFRRTRKALTITGYRLDTIRELTNIDRAIDWAIKWGERRKAAAIETAAPISGNGFNSSSCKYSTEQIEQMVHNGAPDGANRSEVFHSVVGHYLGCGWTADQICEHMQQFPNGIAERYLYEERLAGEIARSVSKYAAHELPFAEVNGGWTSDWETKAPQPEQSQVEQPQLEPQPEQPQPKIDDDIDNDELDEDDADLDEDDLEDENDLEDRPTADPKLPPLRKLGDQTGLPKKWLLKGLLPETGTGLLGGRRSTGKTFTAIDLAISVMTCQPFLNHTVKRQCGVLWFAAEGQDEVELRLSAALREKCGGLAEAPFRWYETVPQLLQKGAVEKLIMMAEQAEGELMQEHGLPLGLVLVDTITSCAGYSQRGDENDNAVAAALMLALQTLARKLKCFVLAVAHLSDTGIRGGKSKEDLADTIWVCLGDHQFGTGPVTNTRLVVEKNRSGKDGLIFNFALRLLEEPEPDEDGDVVTTMCVDWLPFTAAAPPPPDDPWLEGCHREDQRVGMSRFKRVLMAALAEHGTEREIPSTLHVNTSLPPIGGRTVDAPRVRMVAQEIVREAFYLCTPEDSRQAQHIRFARARDRAEHKGLISAVNIDGATYLWLARPDPEMNEGD
jgi:hypothetical protein